MTLNFRGRSFANGTGSSVLAGQGLTSPQQTLPIDSVATLSFTGVLVFLDVLLPNYKQNASRLCPITAVWALNRNLLTLGK